MPWITWPWLFQSGPASIASQIGRIAKAAKCRIIVCPKAKRNGTKRPAAEAEQIGADGPALLQAIFNEDAPDWLRAVPAIRILHKVLIQNYTWKTEDQLRWRQPDELPPPRSPFTPRLMQKHVSAPSGRRSGWDTKPT